jgi:hypothetical protein
MSFNWENILVACTNYPAIYSIKQAFWANDTITFIVLLFVALASFISHLVENHKHGMNGIGLSTKVSFYLNRVDIIACICVIFRLIYLYCAKYGTNINILLKNKYKVLIMITPIIFLAISEYDKYNHNLKTLYIIMHSLWHISIFVVINIFLKIFIYI